MRQRVSRRRLSCRRRRCAHRQRLLDPCGQVICAVDSVIVDDGWTIDASAIDDVFVDDVFLKILAVIIVDESGNDVTIIGDTAVVNVNLIVLTVDTVVDGVVVDRHFLVASEEGLTGSHAGDRDREALLVGAFFPHRRRRL
ncbi:hypothetical protein NDU88_004708 [Pleurodeles waltl]|uniref:Uncharacterized protein n=1 Tax=Pleurodeles waltl TaxID=8319 RepID=A0AAV7T996_PLEWA|nr:hypothetical protein NDU88_004708 [Pleurodeles waltl]